MKLDTYDLQVELAPGAGPSKRLTDYDRIMLMVSGTFTATLDLEGSDNNTDWFQVFSVIAPAQIPFQSMFRYYRVNTIAYTNGTPTVKLVGRDATP